MEALAVAAAFIREAEKLTALCAQRMKLDHQTWAREERPRANSPGAVCCQNPASGGILAMPLVAPPTTADTAMQTARAGANSMNGQMAPKPAPSSETSNTRTHSGIGLDSFGGRAGGGPSGSIRFRFMRAPHSPLQHAQDARQPFLPCRE